MKKFNLIYAINMPTLCLMIQPHMFTSVGGIKKYEVTGNLLPIPLSSTTTTVPPAVSTRAKARAHMINMMTRLTGLGGLTLASFTCFLHSDGSTHTHVSSCLPRDIAH